MDKVKGNKITFRLNDETLEQLERIREVKYPRADDKAKLLRWLIEDVYADLVKVNET